MNRSFDKPEGSRLPANHSLRNCRTVNLPPLPRQLVFFPRIPTFGHLSCLKKTIHFIVTLVEARRVIVCPRGLQEDRLDRGRIDDFTVGRLDKKRRRIGFENATLPRIHDWPKRRPFFIQLLSLAFMKGRENALRRGDETHGKRLIWRHVIHGTRRENCFNLLFSQRRSNEGQQACEKKEIFQQASNETHV